MAHDCPDCGMMCYCDIDDSNDALGDDDCVHQCQPEDEDDED